METINLNDFNSKIYDINEIELNFKGDKLAIIDFYADWCGPCRMVGPIMEELKDEYSDKIDVYKVDVDSLDGAIIAEKFKIRNIPTVIYANPGDEPSKMIGAYPKTKYIEAIENYLGE